MIDSKSSSSVFQTCNGKIESYNLELGISMVGVANWLETKNLRMFSHSKLLEKKSLLRWGKQNFFHMCFNKLDLSEIKTEIFKCRHENWCNFKFGSILIACCSSVAQSFLTLCDSMDCSTPGFPGACTDSCPLNRWCHPSISPSVAFISSCLQLLPASGSF